MKKQNDLSRRERQVLQALYRLGEGSAEQIRSALEDSLSNSTVRTLLRALERKGHVVHRQEGPRFTFSPVVEPPVARKRALKELLNVFFVGSPADAFETLIDLNADELESEDYDRMAEMIERARRQRS